MSAEFSARRDPAVTGSSACSAPDHLLNQTKSYNEMRITFYTRSRASPGQKMWVDTHKEHIVSL